MVELLKQPAYQPLNVIDQIMVIFAGNSGMLDDVPVAKVRDFETGLLQFLHSSKSSVVQELTEKKELTPEIRDALTKAIGEFKASFTRTTGAAAK
jgi:F-type H+-transporting ATPase subunit alpha